MVTAKFICVSVSRHANPGTPGPSTGGSVELKPVYGTGNEEWSKATPSGQINLSITNPAALDQFIAGHAYTITIEDDNAQS